MAQIVSRETQVKEILTCGKDAVYFMRNYVKIEHPMTGVIPFDTYPFQDDCVRDFQAHRFNIVLKSRQLGLSTVTAAYCVWYSLFKKNKNILVIATKHSVAINFIKKVTTILENLPKWLFLTSYELTKQKVTFSNGSSIKAIPTSADAGRSEALSLLVIDEAAFIRNFDEIWTGLKPTMNTGGSAIVISTPNGQHGMYYKLWVDAMAKVNGFNPVFLPWTVHPEHDQAWFDKETNGLDPRSIAQEFLCDFVASGGTFLSSDVMNHLRSVMKQPIRKESENELVWIWKDQEPGRRYILSADVARGDSSDFSTFHVIDWESKFVCAEYMGKVKPDCFADIIEVYGKKYNNALLAIEKNTYGFFTNSKLKDKGYSPMYYKNTKGDPFIFKPENPDDVPGFDTQSDTRPVALGRLEESVRNKSLILHSQRSYDQFQSFIWKGQKAQAANKDSHDDLIMSLSIACYVMGSSSAKVVNNYELEKAMLSCTSKESISPNEYFGDINSVGPPSIYSGLTNKNAMLGRANKFQQQISWLLE